MNYLLDTCVLSEFTRHKPDEKVIGWLDRIAEQKLFLSAITIGEIQRGIERLPESHRKTELLAWLNMGLIQRFGAPILPVGTQTMFLWGSLTARMEKPGRPMPVMDSLIGATALQNNLILVTRNVADFLPCGVHVINTVGIKAFVFSPVAAPAPFSAPARRCCRPIRKVAANGPGWRPAAGRAARPAGWRAGARRGSSRSARSPCPVRRR